MTQPITPAAWAQLTLAERFALSHWKAAYTLAAEIGLPVKVCGRLLFARWLFERGRLVP